MLVERIDIMNIVDILNTNQAYFEDFVTRATYHSNALEGSTLTRNETYALTFDSNHCMVNANAKEIHQAINHKKAMMEMINRINAGAPLNHEYMTKMNSIINENIMFGGAYREDSAHLDNSIKVLPGPDEIEEFLNKFIDRFNDLVANGFTMEDVADMHIRFENIHPFSDGNGRTGRILINSMLIRGNQAPIVIPLEMRNDYIKALETNNVKGMAEMFRALQDRENERIENFTGFEEE